MRRDLFLSAASALLFLGAGAHGFVSHEETYTSIYKRTLLSAQNDDEVCFNGVDLAILQDRIHTLKVSILEDEINRPPNTLISPSELIREILHGLLNPFDPLPDAGFRLVLRTATKKWRKRILQSVGANDHSNVEIVASALGSAIERPGNQFAILVGDGQDFILEMSEPLNFGEECWVECKLRDKNTSELLVITGWNLLLEDGMWLVDNIEWQDFREEFRPGIGREEWFRDAW